VKKLIAKIVLNLGERLLHYAVWNDKLTSVKVYKYRKMLDKYYRYFDIKNEELERFNNDIKGV